MAMTILISDVDGYPVYVVIKKKKKWIHIIENLRHATLYWNNPNYHPVFKFQLVFTRLPLLVWIAKAKKKKTSLFPVAGLKIAMRNAFFFFFFTIHEKAMRNAVFIFLNKTSGRKYIKTIVLKLKIISMHWRWTRFHIAIRIWTWPTDFWQWSVWFLHVLTTLNFNFELCLQLSCSPTALVVVWSFNAVCFGIKMTWNIQKKKKKNPKSYLYTRIMIESVKSLYNQFGDRAELYSIKYHDKIKMWTLARVVKFGSPDSRPKSPVGCRLYLPTKISSQL